MAVTRSCYEAMILPLDDMGDVGGRDPRAGGGQSCLAVTRSYYEAMCLPLDDVVWAAAIHEQEEASSSSDVCCFCFRLACPMGGCVSWLQ